MKKFGRIVGRFLKSDVEMGVASGFGLGAGTLLIGIIPAVITGKEWLIWIGVGLYIVVAILAISYIRREDKREVK